MLRINQARNHRRENMFASTNKSNCFISFRRCSVVGLSSVLVSFLLLFAIVRFEWNYVSVFFTSSVFFYFLFLFSFR